MNDDFFVQEMLKGDWYSWNADDWVNRDNGSASQKVLNETVVDVCSLSKSKYEYFPDQNEYFANHRLCKLFGGTTANTNTQKLVNETADFVTRHCEIHGCWASFYTRYNDIDKFNEWGDYETKEASKETMLWAYGEPNGGNFENCGQMWTRSYEVNGRKKWYGVHNDLPCEARVPSLCEGRLSGYKIYTTFQLLLFMWNQFYTKHQRVTQVAMIFY